MTQAEKVIELLNAGQLDFMTAEKHGVKQLKTRICQLRKAGHEITGETVSFTRPDRKKIEYKVYSLAEKVYNYKRGQKKKEIVSSREYTCEVGEDVWHEGRRVLVQEVLSAGSERLKEKAYIKGCSYHQDGTPARMCNVYPGTDWTR